MDRTRASLYNILSNPSCSTYAILTYIYPVEQTKSRRDSQLSADKLLDFISLYLNLTPVELFLLVEL